MDRNLINSLKERNKCIINLEIKAGKKPENIRLFDIDWDNDELRQSFNEMIQEGIVEETENDQILVVTLPYFYYILSVINFANILSEK